MLQRQHAVPEADKEWYINVTDVVLDFALSLWPSKHSPALIRKAVWLYGHVVVLRTQAYTLLVTAD